MLSIRNGLRTFRVAIVIGAVFAVMAGFVGARVFAQDLVTQDLTTLSAADISAYRWQALGRFYAGQAAAPAAKAVPFKGIWESSEVPTFAPAPPPDATTMYVDGDAWGNATHLGKYTATFEATVDLVCGCSQGDTVHFIAANGDSLYGVGSGFGVPADTAGFNRVVQTYTITGGTGRFAGASGTFTVTRLANNATGASSGSIAGSIVMPTGK